MSADRWSGLASVAKHFPDDIDAGEVRSAALLLDEIAGARLVELRNTTDPEGYRVWMLTLEIDDPTTWTDLLL